MFVYKPLNDTSRWPDTAYSYAGGAPLALPALTRDMQADVVVIGGGFVGCAAALHLAEAGKSVILLEQNQIG
ncbi:MAG: FAD-dependent oxidoreductase [Pararhodobacter sp.]|nr:FAD-dependent oxidoreductase [Pararhodobacter sp.]